MSVHTGTYKYVPTCTLLGTGKFQVGTYHSRQFLKSTYCTEIDMYECTGQYRAVQATVQGGTGRYMTVQGSTSNVLMWYRAVHDGTKRYRQSTCQYSALLHWYMSVHVGTYGYILY